MKKFFLFRKEEISLSSVTASDTGAGVSVFAVPASSLAFATASRGSVKLTFNDASIYEESNLTDGESFEKTTVTVPCGVGNEAALIESILTYISREGGKAIMRFDAVSEDSLFGDAEVNSDISSKIHVNPTKRLTGKASTQTFIGSSGTVGADVASNVVGEIDFGIAENKPLVDYNHEYLHNDKSVGDEIDDWTNAGTGGTTYNISSNVGTPNVKDVGDLSKRSARLAEADHLIIPTVTVSGDYTLYAVFTADKARPLYGDTEGECFGFTYSAFVDDGTGAITKIRGGDTGRFAVRHDGRLGEPAISTTIDDSEGTVSYKYPDYDNNTEKVLVFVIRRDPEGNMYMYNRDGSFVSFIDAVTDKTLKDQGIRVFDNTDGRTDGDLKIDRLGTIRSLTTDSFKGSIARFGVITKDIGSSSCSKLATDLFELYT